MTNIDSENYGEPRDPSRLVSLSYFLTTIGAGFLLADNWKRLGKPEWAQTTLLLSIGAGVTALAIIVGTIAAVTSSTSQRQLLGLMFPAIGLGFGINFGCMFAIMMMQNPAYKKWKKEGRAAMLAHEYNLRRGIITFGVIVALSTVGFTIFFLLTRRS